MLSAEQLAMSLPKGRQIGANRFVACCPAHEDRSPSLSISQTDNRTVFHCHAHCSQAEVIDAFTRLGLWNPTAKKYELFSRDELSYMLHFCLAWNGAVRNGVSVSACESEKMQSYVVALERFHPRGYGLLVRDAHGY